MALKNDNAVVDLDFLWLQLLSYRECNWDWVYFLLQLFLRYLLAFSLLSFFFHVVDLSCLYVARLVLCHNSIMLPWLFSLSLFR